MEKVKISRARIRRRLLADRLARRLVALGGMAIILSILAIFFVIVAQVIPLFRQPSLTSRGTIPPAAPARPLVSGVDEYREVAFFLNQAGAIQFVSLKGRWVPGSGPELAPDPIRGQALKSVPLAGLGESHPTAVGSSGGGRYVAGTSDGRAIPFEVRFNLAYREGGHTVTPEVVFQEPVTVDPEQRRPVRNVALAVPEGGPVLVAQVGPKELVLHTIRERKALIGSTTRKESLRRLFVPTPAEVTALAMDDRADDLFLGTAAGKVLHYDLREENDLRPEPALNLIQGGVRPRAGPAPGSRSSASCWATGPW